MVKKKFVTAVLSASIVLAGYAIQSPTAARSASNGSSVVTYTLGAPGEPIHVHVEGNQSYYQVDGSKSVRSTCFNWGGYYVGWVPYTCWKTQTINYYQYPSFWINRTAQNISATVNGFPSGTSRDQASVVSDIRFVLLELNRSKLFSGDSARFTLDYDLLGSPVRSNDPTRVSAPYTYFCAWAGVLDSGSVNIVVPPGYESVSVAGMTKTSNAGTDTYSSGNITDPASTSFCLEAINESQFTSEKFTTDQGSQITLLSYPGDSVWESAASSNLLQVANALESLTGVPLSINGPVRVREAAAKTELIDIYAGDYDEGLARVSEDFDLETMAHELAHHWYGLNLVDNWAFEGLAEYLGKESLAVLGKQTEENPCNLGWYYKQETIKSPVQLIAWERTSPNATGNDKLSQQWRVATLYKNACAVIASSMLSMPVSSRQLVLSAIARGASAFDSTPDSPLTSREVLDLLTLGELQGTTPYGVEWINEHKLGLMDDADQAKVGVRAEALKLYAPVFSALMSVGWAAPTYLGASYQSWDFGTGTKDLQATDALAQIEGFGSFADLITAAATAAGSVSQDIGLVSRTAESAANPIDAVASYAAIQRISEVLLDLQNNPRGSADPLSSLGRAVLGDPESIGAMSLEAFLAGDLTEGERLATSALSARDSAWLLGSLIILVVAGLLLAIWYRTAPGKKRLSPYVARFSRRLVRRKRIA